MLRTKRKARIRAKIRGTKKCPRLSVFRSNKFVYAQLVDDTNGATLLQARGIDARLVGEEIARAAKQKKIGKVVFDRGGYKYHGKVKLLAEAARKGGLKF